jgi:ABC-type transport system involved in cytochrome c biogenesis ATPase subunit
LDLGQPPTLDYKIKYECKGHVVEVEGSAGERSVKATEDGMEVASSKVMGKSGRSLRPDFVFGYYSGPTNRLEEHFRPHQDRFYRDLVAGIENPLRPLFYARTVHSNFVLLAFFLEEDPLIAEFLHRQLAIESLDSVLFEMQKPEWNSKVGDARFWYARGTVQVLLDRLYEVALAPMRLQLRVKTGIRKSKITEHLYLYLAGIQEVRSISSLYDSNQEFFKALESTYISDLIYDVRVRVKLRSSRGALTFRELSEGEQQLLLVLGLIRFTREAESLFLLDEPDTHLNPAWSAQYRIFLQQIGGLGELSQVLMSTHDPLVISALKRNEVRIFERAEDGTIKTLVPMEDPQGMGVGSLLTSDVYGLRSQFDWETFEHIERKRFLAAKESLTEEEGAELARLAKALSNLTNLMEDPDPDFQEYLQARYRVMGAAPEFERSQEQIQEDRERADALVRRILARESEEGTSQE